MYVVKGWMAVEIMQCKRASSSVDLGYQAISHSCGDISVLLDLWHYSWGLSGFPLSKSTFHLCFFGIMELLCTQCTGFGPHLAVRRKSLCFFYICGGNLGYILELRRCWPFKTRICLATSWLLSCYEGQLRNLQEAWQGNMDASRG